MNRPYRPRLAALLLAQIALASAAYAGTSWDAGGASNTNIDLADNWDGTAPGVVNALNGTTTATFGTAGSLATMNVDGFFTSVTLNRTAGTGFTIDGPSNLVIRSTNSGGTAGLTSSSSLGGNGTINAPLRIDTNNADANKLFVVVNNTASKTFSINGTVARSAASSGNFTLRYSGATTAVTRFNTNIANVSGIQQAASAWQGDLILAGNQTSGASLTISSSAGYGTPASTARLILGESMSDVQNWGSITLNNTMKIAVGGNVTAGSISAGALASAANTRIVGYTSSNSSLSLSGGTVSANMTIGGVGTNENNINIVKAGTGVLTLNGTHTYTGSTTVGAGTLSLVGTIASPIVVNSGATLSGEGTTTGSLTFAPGASTLSFDPSTQTAALTAASLSAAGSTVLLSPSGSLVDGTPYTLLKLTGGTFSGNATDNFLLGSRSGSLSYTNNSTELTVTGTAAAPATLIWTGANGTNPTFWDAATTVNWTNNSTADRYFAGDSVIFDDTAASTAVAIQGASVAPGAITFNNSSAKNYTLSGGIITGTTSLTKSGNGTLSLSTTGTSTFSGGITLNDGVLDFTSLNQLGLTTAPAIQVNGGTLRLSGNATSVGGPAMTFNANSTFDITGPITTTLRLAAKISGAGNITKSGTGVLALGTSGNGSPLNDFTGTVTVTGGALDIRHSDSLGSTAAGTNIEGATLLIQNFGQTSGNTIAYAEPLTFSGTSYLTLLTQETKDFTHQLTGNITVDGTLNVATAVTTAAIALRNTVLEFSSPGSISTATGSTLAFGSRPALPVTTFTSNQTILVFAPISGNGSVVVNAGTGSVITFNAPHSYTGSTSVTSGSLKLASDSLPSTTTLTIASSGASLVLDANDTVNKLYIDSTQMNAGTYTSAHASGVFTGSGTLTVTTGPDLYAAWAGPSGFNLTGNDALKTADPDADGLINLLEYATGTSPVAAGGTPGYTVAPSGDFLALNYTRVADPTLTYTVEGSSDLTGAWSTIAVTDNPSTGVTNVAGNVTITDTTSFTGGKRFLRLKVSQ